MVTEERTAVEWEQYIPELPPKQRLLLEAAERCVPLGNSIFGSDGAVCFGGHLVEAFYGKTYGHYNEVWGRVGVNPHHKKRIVNICENTSSPVERRAALRKYILDNNLGV